MTRDLDAATNSNHHSNNGPSIPRKLQTKILESVQLNRLTIVVGPTGCGKSTLVPSLLLKGLNGPICCTQPRRLAVVAISKRVARLQGVKLGGDKVGYRVGNQNRSLKATSLLFTTAGILLEELRANGVKALQRFKCLIIDECHERSPESDLVLALTKAFMKAHPKAPIRLVLMSATFDHKRYAAYFKGVPGCGTIDTITLETGQSFAAWHQQVATFYLDDMEKILDNNADEYQQHESFLRLMRRDPNQDLHADTRSLSAALLKLIRAIVTSMDKQEDPYQPFLIFCPTYRHLEQLYEILGTINGRITNVSVLHSAVDIEDCIRTMYEDSHAGRHEKQRHIFLASAIADSSITISGVAVVIDLCRSLEVRWNIQQRQHQPRTVWSSKSVCNQRQGRTGRTCAGKVIRLVYQNFFISNLEPWDVPQLQMSSCHNEVLAILCADAHQPDPIKFFASCLDPPPQRVVEDALLYLQEIGACVQTTPSSSLASSKQRQRQRLEPTLYGKLMAHVPVSVNEARVILEGARLGFLHEIVALMAIYLHKPNPIVHHFGDTERNQEYLEKFLPGSHPTHATSPALANLSAYMYWDFHWHQNHCAKLICTYERRVAAGVIPNPETETLWSWTEELEEEHGKWCRDNDINPTSVRSISETIESTMNVLFLNRFDFDFLRCANLTPLWKRHKDWTGLPLNSRDMFSRVYGPEKSLILCEALKTLCESKSALKALPDARRYHELPTPAIVTSFKENRPMACIHHLLGQCKYGDACRKSHSPTARRPPCRFFQNGACAKGAMCVYSHEDSDDEDDLYTLAILQQVNGGPKLISASPLVPLIESLSLPRGPLAWFQENAPHLFMLGEGQYAFSKSLAKAGMPPRFASNLEHNHVSLSGTTVYTKVDATRLHVDNRVVRAVQMAGMRAFGWNFPFVGTAEELSYVQESLLLTTLQSLVLLQRQTQKSPLTLALTLQGDQFSRWNVLRSLWRTNWRLVGWCDFDYDVFSGYFPSRANGDKFPCDHPSFYLLELSSANASYVIPTTD